MHLKNLHNEVIKLKKLSSELYNGPQVDSSMKESHYQLWWGLHCLHEDLHKRILGILKKGQKVWLKQWRCIPIQVEVKFADKDTVFIKVLTDGQEHESSSIPDFIYIGRIFRTRKEALEILDDE